MRKWRNFLEKKEPVPTIVGSRGVGKTSIVHSFLSNMKKHAFVTCSSTTTFDDLARRILRELGIDVFIRERTSEVEGEISVETGFTPLWKFVKLEGATKVRGKKITHRIELGSRKITKDTLFEILCSFGSPYYILLDEFDRLSGVSYKIREEIGDLLKDLSDNNSSHECKVIVCGVASSAKELFKGHPSILRQIREIFISPLKKKDILNFLEERAKLIKYTFDRDVIDTICLETDGFPYAVHLVGLESCRACRKRESNDRYVTYADLEQGRFNSIKYAYHDYLEKYKDKIDTFNISETKLIEYINFYRYKLINKDDIKAQIETNDLLKDSQFDISWDGIVNRCNILYEHPSRKNRYIFTDPLLRPFLRMQFGYPPKKRPKLNTDPKQHEP